MLRIEAGRNLHDRDLSDLIGELSTRSDTFRNRWAAHNVVLHRAGAKQFHHPVVGDLSLAYEVMELSADTGLTLTAYSPEPGRSLGSLNMIAAWYDRQGPASEVLQVGELPDPRPGPGEVRVRVRVSGVNPGDTKKRRGWLGSSMPYPRVIPHSDAAGVVDAVGDGVDEHLVGQRVWTYGAQSYRPFGTAAQFTVVPEALAVPLPDNVGDDVGAALGIPGITAHRAVFADGPVDGKTVLVHGVLGGVSSQAAQLARWGGATVIASVTRSSDLDRVDPAAVAHAVALDQSDPAGAIREFAPKGVHRVVEVALSDNADLDAAVVANDAVIAAYATRADRTEIPFWPMLFANVTLRLLGSDDFAAEAKQQAARDLTDAAAAGALHVEVDRTYPLHQIADAHDHVDAGTRGRVLVDITG